MRIAPPDSAQLSRAGDCGSRTAGGSRSRRTNPRDAPKSAPGMAQSDRRQGPRQASYARSARERAERLLASRRFPSRTTIAPSPMMSWASAELRGKSVAEQIGAAASQP